MYHWNEYVNEQMTKEIGKYCYDLASEFWDKAKRVFMEDSRYSPYVFYDAEKRQYMFSAGKTEEDLDKFFGLIDDAPEELAITPMTLIDFYEKKNKYRDEYIIHQLSRDLEENINIQVEKVRFGNFARDFTKGIAQTTGLFFIDTDNNKKPTYPKIIDQIIETIERKQRLRLHELNREM